MPPQRPSGGLIVTRSARAATVHSGRSIGGHEYQTSSPPPTLEDVGRSEPIATTRGSTDRDASVSLGAGSRASDSEPMGAARFKKSSRMNYALAGQDYIALRK